MASNPVPIMPALKSRKVRPKRRSGLRRSLGIRLTVSVKDGSCVEHDKKSYEV
jgi:hypothetical protein